MAAREDFDLFRQVSEMLGLDEEETENFVTSAMRRRGHKPRIDWDDNPEGGGDQGSGDFFGKKRETRRVGGSQGSQKRQASGGGGWQYGS